MEKLVLYIRKLEYIVYTTYNKSFKVVNTRQFLCIFQMRPPHQAWCDCRPSRADPWRSLGHDPTTGTRQFSTTLLNTAICRVSCFQVCWKLALSSAQFYVKFVVMICTTALLIQTEETKETDSDVR